jgi:threonine dehydratase
MQISLQQIQDAARFIYQYMPPSPQYNWPLLQEKLGHEIWVKHENHNPTGAFKVRGGLLYLHELAQTLPNQKHLISATRGNHGQSIANAAKIFNYKLDIFVPQNNCADKNRAMEAYGAKVHILGKDFDAARDNAMQFASENNAHYIKPFNEILVRGVATYGIELMQNIPDLDKIYVPIGSGSGICGLISARDALGLKTKIIGVVSENADAYKQSFATKKLVSTQSADTIADGIAVRAPNAQAFDIIINGASEIISVSDNEILEAIKILFETTKNIAEGAGAAALAAAIKQKSQNHSQKIAIILSGGNIGKELFLNSLQKAELIM